VVLHQPGIEDLNITWCLRGLHPYTSCRLLENLGQDEAMIHLGLFGDLLDRLEDALDFRLGVECNIVLLTTIV
jgi:hypothetical protein